VDQVLGKRIIALRQKIVAHFGAGNWEEVGLMTGESKRINDHPRLLRSLSWGDEDYEGNVLTVLRLIAERDIEKLRIIESYVDEHFPGEAKYISAKPSEKKITFAPNVFKVPDLVPEDDLVAVMMPLRQEFAPVYESIKRACVTCGLRCLRADDIWEETTIIQDIFNLVFRANVVVVDFTGKNSNVMYETGIAHTLGKHVVPISQSIEDVPFDITHHRVLKYLRNAEGIVALEKSLTTKLRQFATTAQEPKTSSSKSSDLSDDIPF
jgi:hypothetical protein